MLKDIFIFIKNAACFAVTTIIDEEYGFTAEVQKIQQKRKLRKKPKRKE